MYKRAKRLAVAGRIKKYLKDNEMKQYWLAKMIGTRREALNRWLNTNREIPLVAYIRVCKALNVPLDYFIEDSDYEGDLYD